MSLITDTATRKGGQDDVRGCHPLGNIAHGNVTYRLAELSGIAERSPMRNLEHSYTYNLHFCKTLAEL